MERIRNTADDSVYMSACQYGRLGCVRAWNKSRHAV